MSQILYNLIHNAVKFTERGSVRVSVEATGTADGLARVVVADSGIGISPEQRLRLFQPFFQADDSATRRFGGTGTGLYISRRLARLMGGDVVAEDNQQAGAAGCVFALKLPLKK